MPTAPGVPSGHTIGDDVALAVQPQNLWRTFERAEHQDDATQIAFLDQDTGECGEQRLNHSDREAEKLYRDLKRRGSGVRVGMEL